MVGGVWSPASAHRRQRWLRRTAFGDVTGVFRTAVTVLLRHWPVLVALSFAGLGARDLLTAAAVQVSKVNGVLGFMVVVLVPMTTLTALVLMLRAVRASLPWLVVAQSPDAAVGAGSRLVELLRHLGSVLIPFLVVYSADGFLKQDLSNYSDAVLNDAVFNNAAIFSGAKVNVLKRLPFDTTPSLIALVAATVLLRWMLGLVLSRWDRRNRYGWLGILGAYLEVIWLSRIAGLVTQFNDTKQGWVQQRRVVHAVLDGGQAAVGHLGPLTGPAHAVLSFAGDLLGSAHAVIVVPLAWLTAGAVVYGYRIPKVAPLQHDVLDLANQRASRLPAAFRKVGGELRADLGDRFGPMLDGLRLLARSGLRSMLMFCLAFVVVQAAPELLWQVERWIVGPRALFLVWQPLSEVFDTFNDGVRTVLLVALLAGAVDRVIRTQVAERQLTAPVGPVAVGSAQVASAPDESSSDGPGPETVVPATVGPGTSTGTAGLPAGAVPAGAVPAAAASGAAVPVQGMPVQGVPVHGAPVQGVPVQGVPVHGAPAVAPPEVAPVAGFAAAAGVAPVAGFAVAPGVAPVAGFAAAPGVAPVAGFAAAPEVAPVAGFAAVPVMGPQVSVAPTVAPAVVMPPAAVPQDVPAPQSVPAPQGVVAPQGVAAAQNVAAPQTGGVPGWGPGAPAPVRQPAATGRASVPQRAPEPVDGTAERG